MPASAGLFDRLVVLDKKGDKMNTEDLNKIVESDYEAFELFKKTVGEKQAQKIERDFLKNCKALNAIIDDLKHYFPDANYYTGGDGGLGIMIGKDHNDDRLGTANGHLMVIHTRCVEIGDGAW